MFAQAVKTIHCFFCVLVLQGSFGSPLLPSSLEFLLYMLCFEQVVNVPFFLGGRARNDQLKERGREIGNPETDVWKKKRKEAAIPAFQKEK